VGSTTRRFAKNKVEYLDNDDIDEVSGLRFGTVPIEHVVLGALVENVVRRCINANGTKAARMMARLIEDIATRLHTGERRAADFAQAVHERGAKGDALRPCSNRARLW
jgi:hypothetical protein